jgi:hypothetical protein
MSVKTAVGAMLLLLASSVIAQSTIFYCPMHPDVTATAAGKCLRCGMALVPGDPYDLREYRLDLQMQPQAPEPGQALRLRFTVKHPSSLAVVDNFAVVHDKPFHLFVIGQDLESYDHVHPEQQADGSYEIQLTLPKAGYYRLYADFLPIGGAPQVISRVIATANFDGGLAASQARLTPDTTLRKVIDGTAVTLTLPSDGLVAGREETLRFRVEDANSGVPVTDLEPYLGAFGHTLVISADTLQYSHGHPVELLPEGSEARPTAGGPTLTFKTTLPQPGRYRMWTQIKRRGHVSTVQFTVDAASPSSRSG